MSERVIVVTGATGLLGTQLLPALSVSGKVVPLGHSTAPAQGRRIDLTDGAATRALLDELRPEVVLHAAAMTDIDACERDPVAGCRLNVEATRTIADWALQRRSDLQLVYISTDQVYDKPGGSREDEIAPLNIYSFTKLWAEDLVRRLPRHLILRTNFFGPGNGRRPSFVDWTVASCRARRPITLFTDVFFNPLHADHLSAAIGELLERGVTGTYNLGASGGGLSKGDFIRAVAAALDLPTDGCRDGRLCDVPLAARRPHDMRMKLEAAERALGRSLPSLDEGIALLAARWHAMADSSTVAEGSRLNPVGQHS
jgi:dTDP-4-dehydrorhamnose reductase